MTVNEFKNLTRIKQDKYLKKFIFLVQNKFESALEDNSLYDDYIKHENLLEEFKKVLNKYIIIVSYHKSTDNVLTRKDEYVLNHYYQASSMKDLDNYLKNNFSIFYKDFVDKGKPYNEVLNFKTDIIYNNITIVYKVTLL